jgi:hypothetical protein
MFCSHIKRILSNTPVAQGDSKRITFTFAYTGPVVSFKSLIVSRFDQIKKSLFGSYCLLSSIILYKI